MNNNVISTEVLEKMALIFSQAGYLRRVEEDTSKPHQVESCRTIFIKEEENLKTLMEEFQISNGTYFPFVEKQVDKILKG